MLEFFKNQIIQFGDISSIKVTEIIHQGDILSTIIEAIQQKANKHSIYIMLYSAISIQQLPINYRFFGIMQSNQTSFNQKYIKRGVKYILSKEYKSRRNKLVESDHAEMHREKVFLSLKFRYHKKTE